jgi:hypothetical protein
LNQIQQIFQRWQGFRFFLIFFLAGIESRVSGYQLDVLLDFVEEVDPPPERPA